MKFRELLNWYLWIVTFSLTFIGLVKLASVVLQ